MENFHENSPITKEDQGPLVTLHIAYVLPISGVHTIFGKIWRLGGQEQSITSILRARSTKLLLPNSSSRACLFVIIYTLKSPIIIIYYITQFHTLINKGVCFP
uniref:Uncharacterized protein n=1 Tax=Cacopsylla melanoneura TaxID=428564 RepID=A0A8D9EEP4_9HEMI